MRSSTSSFRSEIRVLVVVACVLLAAEVAMRVMGPSFSLELRRIGDIPAEAGRMARADAVRVLVLGNSLTNQGFHADAFKDEMQANGAAPPYVQVRYFPASGACEWHHLFKHFFVDANRIPDVLILPFSMESIWDQMPLTIGRLVYFCGLEDFPEVLVHDLHSFGDRAEFVHSYASSSFANRDKIRQKTFDWIIPYYREGERAIHESAKNAGKKGNKRVKFTYKYMERLLRLAREHGVRVFCVPMPEQETYDVDEKLIRVIKQGGSHLVDVREAAALKEPHYTDGIHLNKKGAAVLSRTLARRLLELSPESFAPRKE